MNEWFHIQDGQQRGPVALEQLQRLAREGQLAAGDLVWSPSMSNWTPAHQVPALAAELRAEARPAAQPAHPPAAVPHPGAGDPVLAYRSPGTSAVMATERALEMLRQTRPWVRITAIVLFVGAGLLLLGGCFGGLAIMAGPARRVGLFTLLYLPLAALYVIPGLYLNRYAGRINDVLFRRHEQDLEAALEAQKSFWKFVGITILVMLGINVVVLLVALGVALM